MKKNGLIALTAAALFSLPLHAADKPNGDEIKRVLDYYTEGSEIVLVDYKLCAEIEKSGENKNECSQILNDGALPLNQAGFLWMNFLVPGANSDNAILLIQFKYKNRVLESDEVKVTSAMRYRTWKRLQTSKSGDWEVSIEQETANGYIPIANLKYTVSDAAVSQAE